MSRYWSRLMEADPNHPVRQEGERITRAIIRALDEERKRQGLSVQEISNDSGHAYNSFTHLLERQNAYLETIVNYCQVMNIEIVLVDREGRALT